ncbi:hypothetical protein [Legionella bononiensis]|uniref:DUF4189 domain-containing protein n=1 Tax=Legionella bononiensis TaxID=2793102 RepID=A0ABS1WCU9_9GAMM|nr:hypothetical protein [Legionella bononiensis]MBL7478953.1 hypothetical protein [Legionella bononiensis]MBL7527085.1 hypothetical protein [Legionella bononiensis]MBL7562054.1 hypothetical protein [Legionella bononiensis]
MKTFKFLLALTIITLSFNASANWLCIVNDAKGKVFNGTGPDRAAALGTAMELCSEGSEFAKNCVVVQCTQQ